MNKFDAQSILRQYEISGEIIMASGKIGDYRTANREHAKLVKIFKQLEKNPTLADECIALFLKSHNVFVRSKGAVYCLALNRNTDAAERVLEEISSMKDCGIERFNAEMTLKVWHEQGCLQIYQK